MGLHIGRWGAMKKMTAEDMLLKEVDNGTLYLGHKKLLPKKAMEKLVEIEGKARNGLAGRSIDFPIAGARFVTYTSMSAVMEELRSLKAEWEEEVANLVAAYPTLREVQLSQLERQANAFINEELKKHSQNNAEERKLYQDRKDDLVTWLSIQKKNNAAAYPTVEELQQKFTFSWRMFRITALDGINELDPEEVQRAQERLRNDLQEWVKTASVAMHQTLGEAAQNAKAMLEKNGKLTPRNIKPLFDAFESFLQVDFTGKSSFRETIETLKSGFLVKAADGSYNLPAMVNGMAEGNNAQFTALLSTLSDLAVSEVAEKAGVQSVTGEFGRFLDV